MITLQEFPVAGKKCMHCKFWSGNMVEEWRRVPTGLFTARRKCINPFKMGRAEYSHHTACKFFRDRSSLQKPCVITKDENGDIVIRQIIRIKEER